MPRSSTSLGQNSNTKVSLSRRRLEKLLGAAYDEFNSKPRAICRRNFVFHMTDWFGDLEKLADLYKHPERFNKKSAAQVVSGFLYHAIWHVRAAGRLMLEYTPEDIFKEIDYKE